MWCQIAKVWDLLLLSGQIGISIIVSISNYLVFFHTYFCTVPTSSTDLGTYRFRHTSESITNRCSAIRLEGHRLCSTDPKQHAKTKQPTAQCHWDVNPMPVRRLLYFVREKALRRSRRQDLRRKWELSSSATPTCRPMASK